MGSGSNTMTLNHFFKALPYAAATEHIHKHQITVSKYPVLAGDPLVTVEFYLAKTVEALEAYLKEHSKERYEVLEETLAKPHFQGLLKNPKEL